MTIYITGSAAAEVIATTLLTPLEAARIRLVSQRGYAKGLVGAVTRLAREQGLVASTPDTSRFSASRSPSPSANLP